MKALIVVTHLLGTGHLARALNLGRAFQNAGHDVQIVSGGTPVPQLDQGDVPLAQLPPLRSDGVNFSVLLTQDGTVASDRYLEARKDRLLVEHSQLKPDVIITELYPFGRRILHNEFNALLKSATHLSKRPLICASIRDILAPPSKPEKAVKTEAILAAFYDAVLVHADHEVTPLDLSWPVSEALRAKLHYSGFVAPPPAPVHPQLVGKDEIIVTAGGGDVGAHIFSTALEAAARSDLHWRFLLGGADGAKRALEVTRTAPANVTVEPARSDFRQMLHHAAASVSMCGYNTALDLLQTGCPAVLIPFDAGGEVEQSIRAKALAGLPAMQVIKSNVLSPEELLIAIDRVRKSPKRAASDTGFDGANETVRIVEQLRGNMP